MSQRRRQSGGGASRSDTQARDTLFGAPRVPMLAPPRQSTVTALNAYAAANSAYNGPKHKFIAESRAAMANIHRAISTTNEALIEQRRYVSKLRKKKKGGAHDDDEDGDDGDEERRDEETGDVGREAEEVLERLVEASMETMEGGEEAIRQLVDLIVDAEDYDRALAEAVGLVGEEVAERGNREREREAAREAATDEKGEVDADVAADLERQEEEEISRGFVSVREAVKGVSAGFQEEYRRMSVGRRYGENNDYAAFKRLLHGSISDEIREVPDKRRWFDGEGRAVLPSREALLGEKDEEVDDGSDDELVIQKVKLDYKCPLSLKEMVEPYSSPACRHVFEKGPIMDYLKQGRGEMASCPVVGCTAQLKLRDLTLNTEMLAILERRKRRQMEEGSDSAEGGDGDDDGEYASINTTRVDEDVVMDEDD